MLAGLAFSVAPVGVTAFVALAVLGFTMFSEAVWNTTRVRSVAPPTHQSRLQTMTSMAFTLAFPIGALWGGVAVDRFGPLALAGGSVGLAVVVAIALLAWRTSPAVTAQSMITTYLLDLADRVRDDPQGD